MSRDYPIPFEYRPFAEAMDRARQNFQIDAAAQLRGMLANGRLQAWSANRSDSTTKLDPAFWTTADARRAIEENIIHVGPTYAGWQSAGRPVFLKADLDARLPTWAQHTAAAMAARREQSLNSRAAKAAEIAPEQSSRDKNVGGRPIKIDWDEFWINIVSIANTPDGLPERPALKRLLEQWITDTGKEIGNTSLNEKLAKLQAAPKRKPVSGG